MPQISLYVTRARYEEVTSMAKDKNIPLSKLYDDVMGEYLNNSWPEGFLDSYYGIMKDDPIEEPEELSWSLDVPRESL